ncbi:hypothetical protein [Thermococcus paralvinellae]|uniref:hypothetical protein n=1 Tax=Thermococcus paralvinellae TaxID=582419 RepID=UPI0005B29DB0|nr:hypothetical protein [Thermococcus paralvinellae]
MSKRSVLPKMESEMWRPLAYIYRENKAMVEYIIIGNTRPKLEEVVHLGMKFARKILELEDLEGMPIHVGKYLYLIPESDQKRDGDHKYILYTHVILLNDDELLLEDVYATLDIIPVESGKRIRLIFTTPVGLIFDLHIIKEKDSW